MLSELMTEEVKYPCPHCGKEHAPEVLYCPIYGEPIPTRADPIPGEIEKPASAANPNRIYLYTAIAALLMFAVGLSLLFRKTPATLPPAVTTQVTAISTTPLPTQFNTDPMNTATKLTSTMTITATATLTQTLTPTATVPTAAPTWRPCEDIDFDSRLHREMIAVVGGLTPLPNRVREGPTTNAEIIGRIQPDEQVLITDGPECASDMVWWKIKSLEKNLKGWTAEGYNKSYWLYPVEPTKTP